MGRYGVKVAQMASLAIGGGSNPSIVHEETFNIKLICNTYKTWSWKYFNGLYF